MNRFRHILTHLDLYLALLVVAAATIYAALATEAGLVELTILSSLGAILPVLIVVRVRLDQILHQTASEVTSPDLSPNLPKDFQSRLLGARVVWLTGVHRSAFLLAHRSTLEQCLRKQIQLRIIFADPAGEAVKIAANRFPENNKSGVARSDLVDRERLAIEVSLDGLTTLAKAAKSDNMKVRVLDHACSYGAIILDPDSADSIAYIEHFTFRVQGGQSKPKSVHKIGSSWHSLACEEFEQMWAVAKKPT